MYVFDSFRDRQSSKNMDGQSIDVSLLLLRRPVVRPLSLRDWRRRGQINRCNVPRILLLFNVQTSRQEFGSTAVPSCFGKRLERRLSSHPSMCSRFPDAGRRCLLCPAGSSYLRSMGKLGYNTVNLLLRDGPVHGRTGRRNTRYNITKFKCLKSHTSKKLIILIGQRARHWSHAPRYKRWYVATRCKTSAQVLGKGYVSLTFL